MQPRPHSRSNKPISLQATQLVNLHRRASRAHRGKASHFVLSQVYNRYMFFPKIQLHVLVVAPVFLIPHSVFSPSDTTTHGLWPVQHLINLRQSTRGPEAEVRCARTLVLAFWGSSNGELPISLLMQQHSPLLHQNSTQVPKFTQTMVSIGALMDENDR